jgi:transposase-like protein
VLETALEAEMSEHLGYEKHDPAGRNRGHSRNGIRSKTVGEVRMARRPGTRVLTFCGRVS